VTAVLQFGTTEKDSDLFHEIPTVIVDQFPYLEDGRGRRAAVIWPADAVDLPEYGVEVLPREAYGWDELIATTRDEYATWTAVVPRACADLDIRDVTVPPQFPVFMADALRAAGVTLRVDAGLFVDRRRVKTAHELAGIRRAQATADAAMGVARGLIGECRPAEEIRAAIQTVYSERDCHFDDAMVAPGPQSASYHEMGEGPLTPGEPVVVDLFPRDRRSRCWSDMTRTFVAGGAEPPEPLAEMWRLCRRSLDASYAAIRAGADGTAVWAASCEPFEAAGWPTQRTKAPGEPIVDGYAHGLGHGVGLDIHERPNLGRLGDPLVAGDVIAIEPALYRQGFGGCRLEDLVLVTEDGYERITDFPYELA
jgi:Xaa-Pro aminopeptidase